MVLLTLRTIQCIKSIKLFEPRLNRPSLKIVESSHSYDKSLKKICKTSFFLRVSLSFSNDRQERAKWDQENERRCWQKKGGGGEEWRKEQKLTSTAIEEAQVKKRIETHKHCIWNFQRKKVKRSFELFLSKENNYHTYLIIQRPSKVHKYQCTQTHTFFYFSPFLFKKKKSKQTNEVSKLNAYAWRRGKTKKDQSMDITPMFWRKNSKHQPSRGLVNKSVFWSLVWMNSIVRVPSSTNSRMK